MPSTAFNPRGTSGSGKTTLVRYIMGIANVTPFSRSQKKVLMYRGVYLDTPLYVLGSYESTCGGCDTIDSVHKVAAFLRELMNDHDPKLVVYEGLMISHMIGTVGAAIKPYGQRHVMGFLSTPLDVCLTRIQERRNAKGSTKPFNPENTIKDHASVLRCRGKAIRDGFTVVDVDYLNATLQAGSILHGLHKLANSPTLD